MKSNVQTIKIEKIIITNLFFKSDYFLQLKTNEHITILIGPNGCGKTTVLKMLNYLFKGNFYEFSNIPYNLFELDLNNNTIIRIYRTFYMLATQCLVNEKYNKILTQGDLYTDNRIFFEFVDLDNEEELEIYALDNEGFSKLGKNKKQITKSYINKIRQELEENLRKCDFLNQKFENSNPKVKLQWIDEWKNKTEVINSDSWEITVPEISKLLDISDKTFKRPISKINGNNQKIQNEPGWLKFLRDNIPLIFIESQRLITLNAGNVERKFEITVNCYSDELKELIQNAQSKYINQVQSFDQTYFERLIKIFSSQNPDAIGIVSDWSDYLILEDRWDNLNNYRIDLGILGILPDYSEIGDSLSFFDKYNFGDNLLSSQAIDAIELYINDSMEKLKVFDDIAVKLSLFQRILKKLLIGKEIIFDSEDGFRFWDSQSESELLPNELSSGEQNTIILYFDLLFRTKPNSLILIDEPEISWHIAWQRQFVNNLLEIQKIIPIEVIIATHSPSIIYNHRNLAIECIKGINND